MPRVNDLPFPPKDPKTRELYFATARARKERALELSLEGNSVKDIALRLGVHKDTAGRWIRDALEELHKQSTVQEKARHHLMLDLMRCEAIIKALWPRRGEARHAEVISRYMERKARMLGYDQPTRAVTLSFDADLNEMSLPELEQEVAKLGYLAKPKFLSLPGEESQRLPASSLAEYSNEQQLPTEVVVSIPSRGSSDVIRTDEEGPSPSPESNAKKPRPPEQRSLDTMFGDGDEEGVRSGGETKGSGE